MSTPTPPVVRWHTPSRGILHLVLDSPPANALSPPILEGLHAALDEAESNNTVSVIVVSSAMPRFFAAGADIKHLSSIDAKSFTEYGDDMRAALDRLAAPERITIAAVEGLALGGGLELAMACALRVGGRDARFGLPEVKLGLIPGAGGTQRLPRLVGRGRALDMMLTGRQVPADEAHAMGLIDRLVDPGTAEEHALALAGELCALSLPALQAVIRTVDAAFDVPIADGFAFETAQEQGLFEHGDAAEGIAAFLEKRPPRFSGP